MASMVDFSDVQGLVRFGYANMTEAVYLILEIRDLAAARTWISHAPVMTAEDRDPIPSTALQIAFTHQGLESLGVPERILSEFSLEFRSGISSDENRSRRLGDTGTNAPANWKWGGSRAPHLVVMLFAEDSRLDAWQQSVTGVLFQQAFNVIAQLDTSDLGGREHFGFIDGISQPQLDWSRVRTVSVNGNQLAYGNLVCLGEFLLGYPNEYSRYTERPLIDGAEAAAQDLPDAENQSGKKDLGKNGTYVVIRQLRQDVRAFWQYIVEATRSLHESGHGLAEAMIGRRLDDGEPLVPLSQQPLAPSRLAP
jgi:deferrochelatase/peroxidase EfeB